MSDDMNMEVLMFEKVNEFWYLEVVPSIKNDWWREIGLRIRKAERVTTSTTKRKLITF